MIPQSRTPIVSSSMSRAGRSCWRCKRSTLELTIQANKIRLDTAGTEQFTAMRELYMRQGQGFLLVFSITNQNSLNELFELREQIIRIKDNENVPVVLVGNKLDLEDDRRVARARGFQIAQEWGNVPYFEASARLRVNVSESFIALTKQVIMMDARRDQAREEQFAVMRNERINERIARTERRGRRRRRDRCVIL